MPINPPLPVAPLTDDDRAIWFEVIIDQLPALSLLRHISQQQDRRDAERMLGWQRIRLVSEGRPLSFPNVFWLAGDEWEFPWQPAGGQL